MNQKYRDEILLELDKNKKVTNEELFVSELTPYYHFSKNDNLISKILYYNQMENKMLHNSKISFTPEQKRIYDEICISGRYAISATTSFGKTTIIKEYIKKIQPKIIVYVVPTNALADELLYEFESLFLIDDYNIIDTSISENKPDDDKIIFIGTQEKLSDIKWLKSIVIDLFVIDEAYKLSDKIDGYREISLNRNFYDFLNISKTSILLLPLVNSIIGLDKYNIKLLKSDYSPVTKIFIGEENFNFNKIIVKKIKQNTEKNLVYFSSPASLEKFFNNELLPNISNKIKDDLWIKRVINDFHEDWLPVVAYKRGISIHNGSMPKFIQIKMVNMFNKENHVNTILSTSSLIEGVNTPTKNIFIKDSKIFDKKNIIKYKNLIGRAGRLNVTPVGKIYYDKKFQEEFEEANMNWKNIDLKLLISDNKVLDDINRDKDSNRVNEFCDLHSLNEKELRDFIEKSGMSLKQIEILIKKLKEYNEEYNLKQTKYSSSSNLVFLYSKLFYNSNTIVKYLPPLVSKENILNLSFNTNLTKNELEKFQKNIKYKYLNTVMSATMNRTINDKNMYSISDMLKYIKEKCDMRYYDINNSFIVSTLIGFIYNFLPYDLIPLLENINDLYLLFVNNGNEIINYDVITYINSQIDKYNLKYFGKIDCTDKERKIIKRLFEYGIPYTSVKDDLEYLTESIDDNFSINHIKRAIYSNEEVKNKLYKYFE